MSHATRPRRRIGQGEVSHNTRHRRPLTPITERRLRDVRDRDRAARREYASDEWAEQRVSDETWIALAGERDWVVLTKDDAIRRRPAES